MTMQLDAQFIEEINQHIGIAHKVCRMYIPALDEREDLLQEMMYQLWRSYPAFQHHARFSTWMYRVCLNTAITYLRKNTKDKEKSLTGKHLQIPDQSHTQPDDNLDILYLAIGKLTDVNKALILLYLEDLSYEEMAQITGLTVSNVSVRLVRIKIELEKQLNHLNKTENVRHERTKR
ncbi:RNA polymerase sigma factor [Adhaeribacter radiodurans]|uniref:Sigma-70 family RNA polymerase sigma factor n=1 Tax=Adhaeribacter radiodurans TaxID=2745197 RepID=A0A7L7LAP8_9BACT|nr:sigma-70 family RNA polymerase sigma factor [Adhaeribacter radiodurans]QMU29625.1 sigma-70 family RNA polymerase sigma factor [Adhaeribacter radiodurans]